MTSQEGEAFLEEHGKLHEDAKTRAQQKELEETEEDATTKLKRTSTMAATAQVVIKSSKVVYKFRFQSFKTSGVKAVRNFEHLLKQEGSDLLGDEERGKTRSETAALKDAEDDEDAEENSDEENGDCEENGAEKPAVKRDGTMVVTASVRSFIIFFS